MCLVVIAHTVINGRSTLVIAANRDEYHERPAEALHWWPDHADIAGGRDRRAGGTWLGVRRDGRFATVLNGTAEQPPSAPRSRGELVTRWLTRPEPRAATLQGDAMAYAGFHCLLGDREQIHYLQGSSAAPCTVVAPVACGNGGIDAAGPRVERAASAVTSACTVTSDPAPQLFAALADRSPPVTHTAGEGNDPEAVPGDTRPVFIVGEPFGTRCSSVVMITPGHRAAFHERRFDGQGGLVGERTLAWPLGSGG